MFYIILMFCKADSRVILIYYMQDMAEKAIKNFKVYNGLELSVVV